MPGRRKLEVVVDGDTKGLSRSLGQADSKLKGFAGGIAKAGAMVGKSAVVIGVAAVAAGAKVLDMGARFEDLDNKAGAVFEDQLPAVKKWAAENAGAMGLTGRQLTGLTANFADLLKPMGFTADQAAGMAMETNELAGALAKWSGGQKDAAEVSEILAKAMLGERSQLKGLGISITEADVQARLAANGQKELTGAALEQAKAIATQELIIEKSTDAQAAWADGQDSLGVKLNKARARVQEFKERAVETLLPFVVEAAERFAEWGRVIAERMQPVLEDLQAWWDQNGPAIIARAQELWAVLQEVFTQIAGAVATVVGWFRRGGDDMTGTTSSLQAFFAKVWPQISGTVTSAVDAIRAIVDRVARIVRKIWEMWGDRLLKFAEQTWGNIQRFIGGVLDIIQGIFEVFAGVFSGDWSRAWEGVKQILSGVWTAIKAIVGQAFDAIRLLASIGLDALKRLFSMAWEGIKRLARAGWEALVRGVRTGIDNVVDWFRRLPGRIATALAALPRQMRALAVDAIRSLISGLGSMTGAISRKAGEIKDNIVGKLDPRNWFSTPEEHYRMLWGDAFDSIGDEGRKSMRGIERLRTDLTGALDVTPPDVADGAARRTSADSAAGGLLTGRTGRHLEDLLAEQTELERSTVDGGREANRLLARVARSLEHVEDLLTPTGLGVARPVPER